MTGYQTQTDDANKAVQRIRLLAQVGELTDVRIGAEVDMDVLLDAAASGGIENVDEVTKYTDPADIVDLAEENDIPPVHVLREAAERIDGMFVRTPSAEELGLEDTPETAINQAVRQALESLSDGVEEPESERKEEPGETAAPEAEAREEPDESREAEPEEWETPERDPTSRKGIEFEDRIENGKRREETEEFLRSHRGEWVDAVDYAEAGDFSHLSSERQQRDAASAALHRVKSRGWLEVETRRRGNRKEYRLPVEVPEEDPEELLEEAEAEAAEEEETAQDETESLERRGEGEMPGQVTKASSQHEVLALLTHLCEREDEPQPIKQLVEVSQHSQSTIERRLADLQDKNLAHVAEEWQMTPNGRTPNKWAPTPAGRAELKRTGGFQLNDDE